MSNDVECPYCGEGQEINHDDGYGYEDGKVFEQECVDCRKNFTFTTSTHYYYEAKQADCLNGEDHKLEKVFHVPVYWPDWVRCVNCGYEKRGFYVVENPQQKPHIEHTQDTAMEEKTQTTEPQANL